MKPHVTMSRTTYHVARVPKPCDGHCTGLIHPGERYSRVFVPPGFLGDADWPLIVSNQHAATGPVPA